MARFVPCGFPGRDDQGGIVIEYRLGLLEAHAMLAQIGLGLPFIPLEA